MFETFNWYQSPIFKAASVQSFIVEYTKHEGSRYSMLAWPVEQTHRRAPYLVPRSRVLDYADGPNESLNLPGTPLEYHAFLVTFGKRNAAVHDVHVHRCVWSGSTACHTRMFAGRSAHSERMSVSGIDLAWNDQRRDNTCDWTKLPADLFLRQVASSSPDTVRHWVVSAGTLFLRHRRRHLVRKIAELIYRKS
jgi:hypothetical protein